MIAAKQHKVFSISVSAYMDLKQKCLFLFPVLAFLQEAIYMNLVRLSGKERRELGR